MIEASAQPAILHVAQSCIVLRPPNVWSLIVAHWKAGRVRLLLFNALKPPQLLGAPDLGDHPSICQKSTLVSVV